MNTLEIKCQHKIRSWKDFILFAKKQFINYEKLEGRNWKKYDFSIDCSEDQMLLKDMLQIRCIEELTEASIAYQENNYEHFKEEITDALNFFVSACVMCDKLEKYDCPTLHKISFTKSKFDEMKYSFLSSNFYIVIEKIGYLCNLLKNRPWAQSNYLVSLLDFDERFLDLWISFWELIYDLGFTEEEIFECFERKYEVNKWRIKTGY